MNTELKVNYTFTAIPTNLIYILDNDCYKAISILIQKEAYWLNKNQLVNGYFHKSILELSDELGMKNKKDVRLILEALYRANLIDITTVAKKWNTAKIKLNWIEIKRLAEMNMYDAIEFTQKIVKLSRQDTITYCTKQGTEMGTKVGTEMGTNCTTTINKINNKNNIYINNNILNKRYYLNKEYINNNKIYYKNNLLFNNINNVTPLRVLNENKLEIELIPNDMKKEETVEIRNINKFQANLNKLFLRLETVQTLDELDEKLNSLCQWVIKHENLDSTIDKEVTKKLISNKYNDIKSKLEESENIMNQILIDNFTPKEEKPKEQQTANKEKVEKDLISMQKDLIENGVNDMSLTALNFFKEKFSKEIEDYNLSQLVSSIEELIQPNKAISDVSEQSSTKNGTTIEETEESAGKELKMTLEESLENAMKGTWTLGDGKILDKADIFVPVVEEYPF